MGESISSPGGSSLPGWVRWVDRLSGALMVVSTIALALMALNIIIDVAGRAVWNTPVTGTLELTATWWMPALVLLAFGFTERKQEHIKVTLLVEALPHRMRQIVEGSLSLVSILLLALLTFHTFSNAIYSWGISLSTSGTLILPIWPMKFVAALGLTILLLQFLASAYRYFAGLLPLEESSDAEVEPL